MILVDTHVAVWLTQGNKLLGRKSRAIIEKNLAKQSVGICALSFWEVAMQAARGRISLSLSPAEWRNTLLSGGMIEYVLNGEIALLAAGLGALSADPVDRLIG